MKSTFLLSSLAGIITAEQLRFIQLQSVVTQQFTTVYWPDGVTNVDSVAFAHASTFELHELEGKENYWQLRAVKNNNWLSAENGGGSSTITNRTEPSAWETFHAVFSTDNTVHLKTHEGFYLGIDGTDSSALVATSQVASDWETFKVIDIP